MSAKYILLFLNACLLVQCAFGVSSAVVPLPVYIDSSTTPSAQTLLETPKVNAVLWVSSTDKKNNEHLELVNLLILEISIYTDIILNYGAKMVNEVIAEAYGKYIKSEGYSERIERYFELAKKLKTLKHHQNLHKITAWEEMFQKFHLAEELSSLWEKFNGTALENSSSDDQLFEDMLQKHGLEELKKELGQHFVEYSDKMTQQFQRFWHSLTSEEQQKVNMFKEWFKHYKIEYMAEKKFEMFYTFINVFMI